ncbi:MAG: hypothetical protein FD165_141 [Gammaproteobacteria bacterium]|nr:MAG: hypothetical protein FD165_141 [Gammaproteobacteria bacterium]TND06719.1 MAG: hypothetical protein FD120_451 [Gammaproteobacteria bacterium]
MTEPHNDRLGSGLVYTDSIPFSWRQLDTVTGDAAAAHIGHHSLQVLRLILSIEEQGPEPVADADPEHENIARLEFKLNLLIDLVGYLLAQNSLIPPRVLVSLSADGLEWGSDDAPQLGSYVELALYLSPKYPRPVTLPGFIEAVDVTPEGGYRTRAIFPELSVPLQDALEKFIFRHHRRIIASRRGETSTADEHTGVMQHDS